VSNVEKHYFTGAHPAGNVGVQIHHIAPIARGEVVWTVGAQEVVFIGRLFLEGHFNTERLVAVAGPEVNKPSYIKTYTGANLETLINDQAKVENVRVISGDVLTGKNIGKSGYLGFYDSLVSVIEEGDFYEMFGWILPSYARPSISPTFPWTLFPNEEFDVNTNTHGEERAFVVTGQYESVLPMRIYPVHLLKAIMANDFELMEGLGIYELAEEDLALCEFVCTSKTNVQEILREGLDYMYEQN
jgi:Na+-transporting NADH:ubiquinone oxidoreductase subunit A